MSLRYFMYISLKSILKDYILMHLSYHLMIRSFSRAFSASSSDLGLINATYYLNQLYLLSPICLPAFPRGNANILGIQFIPLEMKYCSQSMPYSNNDSQAYCILVTCLHETTIALSRLRFWNLQKENHSEASTCSNARPECITSDR